MKSASTAIAGCAATAITIRVTTETMDTAGAVCTCTADVTGITTEIGITTATADPEYTFMYLESAASNWATNILVGHRIGPH